MAYSAELTQYKKALISLGFGVNVLVAATYVLSRITVNAPTHSQVFAGYLTLNSYPKIKDSLVLPSAIALAGIATSFLFRVMKSKASSPPIVDQVLLSFLPSLILLVCASFGQPLIIDVVFITIILVASQVWAAISSEQNFVNLMVSWATILRLVVILFLTPILILRQYPDLFRPGIIVDISGNWMAYGVLVILLTVVYRFSVVIAKFPKIQGQLLKCLDAFIIMTAALMSLPSVVVLGQERLQSSLSFVGFFSIGTLLFTLAIAHFKYHQVESNRVGPVVVSAFLFSVMMMRSSLQTLSSDDFHFGERLIGWWSYKNGATPYVDYVPPHGFFQDDIPAIINSLFFNGQASTLNHSDYFFTAVIAVLMFLSLYFVTRMKVVAIIATWALAGLNNFPLLTVSFLGLIVLAKSERRTTRVLVSGCIGLTTFLLDPLAGVMVSSSAVVLVLFQAKSDQSSQNQRRIDLSVVPSLLVLALLLFSTRSFIVEMIGYVIDSSKQNQIAFGIPWALSWGTPNIPELPFEIFRNSWVFVTYGLFVILLWPNISRKVKVTALMVIVQIVAALTYFTGRIDVATGSRLGRISVYLCLVAVPIILFQFKERTKARNLVLVVATAMGFLAVPIINPMEVVQNSLIRQDYLSTYQTPNGQILKNLGPAVVPADLRRRLDQATQAMQDISDDGETVWNVTNRTAISFYLNRPNIGPISSLYNTVGDRQQNQVLSQLEKESPRIVIAGLDNIEHDNARMSIRAPKLYLWLLDNYTLTERFGVVVGFNNRISQEKSNELRLEIIKVNQNSSEANVNVRARRSTLELIKNSASDFFMNKNVKVLGVDLTTLEMNLQVSNPVEDVNFIDLEVNKKYQQNLHLSLIYETFGIDDLRDLPANWAPALKSLSSTNVVELDHMKSLYSGQDSKLIANAEFLAVNVICGQKANNVLTIRWSSNETGLIAPYSRIVKLTAEQVVWPIYLETSLYRQNILSISLEPSVECKLKSTQLVDDVLR